MAALRAILASVSVAFAAATPVTEWVNLNDGHKFPSISLGTCCGSKPAVGVAPWIAAGGIGVDTSIDYRDEPDIATALKTVGVARDKVYITTKITCMTATPEAAIASVNQSLQNRARVVDDALGAPEHPRRSGGLVAILAILRQHGGSSDTLCE